MSFSQDYDGYSTILFIDSMVALEGKPLGEQPWAEIDAVGPILILVVPQVLSEIDKRKRDGRLGKRAREFNRLIAPAAEAAKPLRIVEGQPAVDIAVAVCDKIKWDDVDDLDSDEPDARVVAQILFVRGVEPAQKLLFTQDINPIAMAARHGLKCRRLPDHWVREADPNPHEKELQKLKAKVRELETSSPDLKCRIEINAPSDFFAYRVRALLEPEQQILISSILERTPYYEDHPFGMGADYGYDDRYKKFCEVQVPRFAAKAHEAVETDFNQLSFILEITNVGAIQADHLVAKMQSSGCMIHDRFTLAPIFGPTPPKRKSGIFSPNFNFPSPVAPKNNHDVYVVRRSNRSQILEINCADFRHGRSWTFEGFVSIDPRLAAGRCALMVELTASNLRGTVEHAIQFEYETKDVAIADLVDIGAKEYTIALPLAEKFNDDDIGRLQIVDDWS